MQLSLPDEWSGVGFQAVQQLAQAHIVMINRDGDK